MKWAPAFVLAGTAAGLAGVLSFHTSPATSPAPAAARGNAAAAPAASGTARSAGSPAAGGKGRRAAGPGGAATASGIRTAAGPVVQFGYGQLSVTVTAAGKRITNIAVTSFQAPEPYSQQLASQAVPMLKSEVLSAQTANINGISGATYTSQAYAQSLQSALNRLHLK